MRTSFFIIIASVFAVAMASVSRAAVIVMTAPTITLDTQGQVVNAIELHLAFDPKEFSIAAMNDGGSVVTAWIVKPTFSNDAGTVDLSGIIPGGIDTANGKIVSFIMTAKQTGATGEFAVSSAQVLLNDGHGTPAPLTVVARPFSASSNAGTVGGSVGLDLRAPDPFMPEVSRDPDLFGGKYFLVFSTTDQGSGIDHYEVLEAPQGESAGDITAWQTAVSPYLLRDQALASDIYVRAVDRTGNLRMVKIAASVPRGPASVPWRIPAVEAGFGILIVGIILWQWKRNV